MSGENNSESSGTITINKSSLWKYSTFILAAVLIVGAFVFFGRGGTGGGTGNVTNNGGAADLSVFMNNPNLYPSIGPSDAKATVIEFSDFQCPYCAIAAGLSDFAKQLGTGQYADLFGSAGKVEQLAQSGKVRFIYVSMSFLGAESVSAAQAALCANDQGKFWQMHDALFAANDGHEQDSKYTNDKLKAMAAGINGIDSAKFNQCLDSNQHASDVQAISQAASSVVQGTPSFFVNGQQVQAGWNSISSAIQSAGGSIN